jgi:hypothetical protein
MIMKITSTCNDLQCLSLSFRPFKISWTSGTGTPCYTHVALTHFSQDSPIIDITDTSVHRGNDSILYSPGLPGSIATCVHGPSLGETD